MYDLVIIGQGMTGMLSAIWGKEQGYNVALASTGTGKIMQSTGLFDLLPGKAGTFADFANQRNLSPSSRIQTEKAVERFQELMTRLGYPYHGNIDKSVPVVTSSGYLKFPALYPETIRSIPDTGRIVVVGFKEISDFSPKYLKGNLEKARPALQIDTLSVSFGKSAGRTMTQLDAARLLDQKTIRTTVMKQIIEGLKAKNIKHADLFVFPASLGVSNWREVIHEWQAELGAPITEAPGMPPNATAIRLHDVLRKEAVKQGVRFYFDTKVIGSESKGNQIRALKVQNNSSHNELAGKHYIIATGGILGGGLILSDSGYQETVLGLDVDENGSYVRCPNNVYPVGAALGTHYTNYGITGGIFSILSSYETIEKIHQVSLGGVQNA